MRTALLGGSYTDPVKKDEVVCVTPVLMGEAERDAKKNNLLSAGKEEENETIKKKTF